MSFLKSSKVRFGIVGTNFITDWIIAASKLDERFELIAVYSRTQETADAFALKHNIPHTFTSLEGDGKKSLDRCGVHCFSKLFTRRSKCFMYAAQETCSV